MMMTVDEEAIEMKKFQKRTRFQQQKNYVYIQHAVVLNYNPKKIPKSTN